LHVPELLAATVSEYKPASQLVQMVATMPLQVPAGHWPHADALELEKVPAEQFPHMLAPFPEYVPPPHVAHTDACRARRGQVYNLWIAQAPRA